MTMTCRNSAARAITPADRASIPARLVHPPSYTSILTALDIDTKAASVRLKCIDQFK